MSMYQGIDLSRFKKIAGNDKVSTLRHAKGHEIKIAHASLSPDMREHIAGLPVHLAQGGDPVDVDNESPAEAPEVPGEEVATDAGLPPKPAVMPEAGTIDVVAPRRNAIATPQELDNDAALYADDLQRGHIKPETMQSLYGKKDTVGKIGTLFGLLVGGAGAGLTHQPNAVLAMMQKEIDNDLEAQKASNANTQNYLRLSHEHEMQKANIGKIGSDVAYQNAMTGKIPSEVALNEAHAGSLKADTELKALDAAKTRMQLGILHSLNGNVDKMPPGPSKDNATNVLTSQVAPAVMQDIKKRNEQTAAKLNLRAAVRGDLAAQDPQPSDAGVDFDKMHKLAQLGVVSGNMHLPGGMSPGEVSAANEEAQKVADNRAVAKLYQDSFNNLDSMAAAGKLNPQLRNAEIATLAAKIAHTTVGRYNAEEQKAQASAMFPDATDWGKARDEKFRKAMEYFSSEEAGTPTLDRFKLKTPFPSYARAKSQKKEGSKEQIKIVGGVKYKRGPNGEAVKVD